MQTIEIESTDLLICDPCYIKEVSFMGEPRYDALKCVKTLLEGDDGEYNVYLDNKCIASLGVDSGRIWAMKPEFTCQVRIEAGMSGFSTIKNFEKDVLERLSIGTEEYEEA